MEEKEVTVGWVGDKRMGSQKVGCLGVKRHEAEPDVEPHLQVDDERKLQAAQRLFPDATVSLLLLLLLLCSHLPPLRLGTCWTSRWPRSRSPSSSWGSRASLV